MDEWPGRYSGPGAPKPVSAPLVVILPRIIRQRDASGYLGIDRNKFNADVRPA
jgi:hypothetical protein